MKRGSNLTRKTGKAAVKARQQMKSAKLARYKRELAQAGVKLSLPKPSAKAQREKEEELKRLYLELFPEAAKKEEPAEGAQEETQAEERRTEPEEKETAETAGSGESSEEKTETPEQEEGQPR